MCLFIGMMMGKYYFKLSEIGMKSKIVLAITSFVWFFCMARWICTEGFVFDTRKLLGTVINPPGISLILYAFGIMMSIYLGDKVLMQESSNSINYILAGIAWIGRQTLYIFLYHKLFLDYFLNRYFRELPFVIKIPVYYMVILMGSIGIGYLYGYFKKFIILSYQFKREK